VRRFARLLCAIALAAGVPGLAHAEVRPMPLGGDPRIQTVLYDPQQVVLLQVAPGYQLTVAFAPDERIESVAVGDSGAWQVTPNKRGDYLFIKPTRAGVSTNLTVITDARTYIFDLATAYGPSPDMAFTVGFTYPPKPAQVAAADAAPAGHGRYQLSGDRSVRPAAIDDDGTKTYMTWGADQTLPAVFAIDAQGKEMLVNGGERDGRYVIDSVADALVFRLDKHVARATRVPRIDDR
jgi:type IV secretion system protein VirB9